MVHKDTGDASAWFINYHLKENLTYLLPSVRAKLSITLCLEIPCIRLSCLFRLVPLSKTISRNGVPTFLKTGYGMTRWIYKPNSIFNVQLCLTHSNQFHSKTFILIITFNVLPKYLLIIFEPKLFKKQLL